MRSSDELSWLSRGARAVLFPAETERDDEREREVTGRACRATGPVLLALTACLCATGYWANMQNKPVSNFIVKRFA